MASKYSLDVFASDLILLNKIYRFAGYTKRDLPILQKATTRGDLAMESLVENAISRTGKIQRVNIPGMDFDDGSDAKKVTVVNQGTIAKPKRGAGFSTKNKKGLLRVVVVDPMVNEVFYFKIPPEFYVGQKQKRREVALRIPFSKFGGKPQFTPNATTSVDIWNFEVSSFKELSS
jgi:hypothetical protein